MWAAAIDAITSHASRASTERGQVLVEYVLLLAVVVIATIGLLIAVGVDVALGLESVAHAF